MKKLLLALSVMLTLITGIAKADITQTQLYAFLGIVTNFILSDDGTIVYHGKSYKEIKSPYTGRIWLDRNLGADRVCTSYDDTQCYGDYYQWGRGYDGHQDKNSADTPTLASNVNNSGSSFITSSSSPFDWTLADSDGSQRFSNWSKTDSSSICPNGFRVPTLSELKAETLDANVTNSATAFSNFLKLPSAGYREYDGTMFDIDFGGSIWTISQGNYSSKIKFDNSNAFVTIYSRAAGNSVRCIEKIKPTEYLHNGTAYGEVTSPHTGRVWLDRNLGAKRVCTNYADTLCFGDYYQWGRDYDGHQDKDSATTTTLANDFTSAGSMFVISTLSHDWLSQSGSNSDINGSKRIANWSKTDGTSVCPAGFRVPTFAEIKAETIDSGVTERVSAANNFLRLAASDARRGTDGIMTYTPQYQQGYYWTTSIYSSSFNPKILNFSNGTISQLDVYRIMGFPIRCVKD